MQFYAGYREGRAVELEPLPIQYADYAPWQRSWMEAGERSANWSTGGSNWAASSRCWNCRPTGRDRAVQSPAGDSLQVELGEDPGRSKQLAQQQGVTLFMLLLASFQTLLHRYSGQPEIRVGVPIANRTR